MPHGLGHFMGIDTHDPGGYPKVLEAPVALYLHTKKYNKNEEKRRERNARG